MLQGCHSKAVSFSILEENLTKMSLKITKHFHIDLHLCYYFWKDIMLDDS